MNTSVATFISFVVFSTQLFSQSVISAKSISASIASGQNLNVLGSALDASGNIYLVGWFNATVDFDPGAGVTNLSSNGVEDAFIVKYSSAGAFLWARSYGAGGTDLLRDVAIDPSGNVIISGYFSASMDVDPGPALTKLTSNGNQDIFFAKLSATGDFIFAKSMGGITNDTPASMAVDGSGNIFLSGTLTSTTVDFDPGAGVNTITKQGSIDTWIARYDTNGDYVWAFSVGTTGAQISTNKMTLATGGILYITGYLSGGAADFNPGAGTNVLTPIGGTDIFVAKYDLSGAHLWSFVVGGTGTDISYGMANDAAGNIYITGKFEATVDFNPGASTANVTSSAYGDIYLAKYTPAGLYQFANRMGGAGDDLALTVTVDPSNNPIVGGYFNNTVDFDPGAGTVNLVSIGQRDAFVAKYTTAGIYTWARSFGAAGLDQAYTIVTDASGNVNVAGVFQNTVDFNPAAAVFNLTAPGTQSIVYNLKLNSAGNFVSAFAPQAYLQNMSSQTVGGTWIDADNNFYITGGFAKTVDFDPGPGVTSLTALGYIDMFVAKYNAAGDLVFAKSFTNAGGGNQGYAINTDATGNIYIAARFQGTLDVDPGPAVVNQVSAGSSDILLLKLSSAGSYLASAAMGGTGSDYVYGMTRDNSGNLYITGQFYATVDFNPGAATNSLTSKGGGDAFVAKYNSSLGYVFAAGLGGTPTESGNDIALDASGNIYTVGTFSGTVDFDPGTNVYNLTSTGSNDVYVSKLDNNGNFLSAFGFGSTSLDNGNAIAVDNSGNLYVAGSFLNIADLDPGAGTTELTSAGSGDAFVAKYDASGNFLNARSFGGIENDVAQKMKLDANGNVYLSGQFSSPQLAFTVKGTPVSFNNEGDADAFLSVLDPSLNFLSGRTVGGPQFDQAGALSLDAAGNIYMTGVFTGSANVDNLSGAASFPFKSINFRDIYMLKLSVPEILPVTLEKFSAVQQQTQVLTRWTVSSQINNNYFEVERSVDGKKFSAVGRVAGCASCPGRMDYEYIDKQPLPGVSFYRLKQTDIDGNFTYSRIVRVSFAEENGKLTLYPTLTTGDFTLSYSNKTNNDLQAVVRLINANGNMVQSTRIVLKPGVNNIPMTVMNFASGMYHVNLVLTGSNSVQSATLIRQR